MVSIDVGQIAVSRLIAHRVPRGSTDDTRQPRLTDAVPDLPPETLDFFARRLKRSLGENGQDVEVDERLEAPQMPQLIMEYLGSGPSDLVAASQRAAGILFDVQGASRWEEESLFITCDVSLSGRAALAVMKLEEESGVEWQEAETEEGETVLMVSVNEQLVLTENTRVFKSALFSMDDGSLAGLISDDQQGRPTRVADYFMRRFLGCRHRRSPATTTQAFYKAVQQFISTDVTDQDEKFELEYALKSELSSNRNRIAPQQFISDYVREERQDLMLRRLQEADVPTTRFPKDVSRLGSARKTTRLKTTSGITIAGNIDEVADRVRSGVDDDGTPVIIIRDQLTSGS